ncbi:MAG: peptidoglycan endopeptidase [Mycobacterium sp.]
MFSVDVMFALVTLMSLINQVSGTPYIPGGNTSAGTDCSGLASWVANAAVGRDPYSGRFHTGNEEAALLARGFKYGTAPNALVIGWNRGHTAVTLPDGTPVSSGEGGRGVKVGGGGAYQKQFTHHMYLPAELAAPGPAPAGDPTIVTVGNTDAPPPLDPFAPPPPPAPVAPPPVEPAVAELPPSDPFAPPPVAELPPPPVGQPVIVEPAIAELPPPPADAPAPAAI